jgi:uncharacterized membrane protein
MESSSSKSKGAGRAAPAVGPVRLADALGWGSSILGAPMNLMPRRLLRTIGIKDDRRAVAWTFAVGVREHLATLNIVANRQRRIGMWSRVAGDTMDLVLLAAAYRYKRRDANRLLCATGIVGGLMAVDLFAAVQMTRADGANVSDGSDSAGDGADHDTDGGPTRVRTAVTIRRPQEHVRVAFHTFAWSAFDPAALEESGDVRFTDAPGDRGTEVHLVHEPRASGGNVGAAAAKLLGKSPDQTINDELRRFKALSRRGCSRARRRAPRGRPPRARSCTSDSRLSRWERAADARNVLDGTQHRAGRDRARSADPHRPRRDRKDQLDGDLRIGPAPL